jgi:predicted phage tail protein
VLIQEVASGPTVTSLNCPPSKTDPKSVDTSTDPITCTVSGSNLDQVSSVKLTQGSTTIPGSETAYASGNTATISFKLSDINTAKANGSYELFLTPTGGGKDIDSTKALIFTAPCAAAPSAPASLTATATSSSAVNLTWPAVTPPANCTVSSYNVYGSTTNGFTPGAANLLTNVNATSYSNVGLKPSTTYYYAVEAVDAFGSSPAVTANALTTK